MKLKPGIKTTEVWVTIGVGVIGTALAVLDKCEGDTVVIITGILGAVLTLVRGALKKGAPPS